MALQLHTCVGDLSVKGFVNALSIVGSPKLGEG